VLAGRGRITVASPSSVVGGGATTRACGFVIVRVFGVSESSLLMRVSRGSKPLKGFEGIHEFFGLQ
jgi:hypothetical protein